MKNTVIIDSIEYLIDEIKSKCFGKSVLETGQVWYYNKNNIPNIIVEIQENEITVLMMNCFVVNRFTKQEFLQQFRNSGKFIDMKILTHIFEFPYVEELCVAAKGLFRKP